MTCKLCNVCNIEKNSEFFRLKSDNRSKHKIQYLCSWCKECEKKKALDKYHSNKERYNEQNKLYKQENRETINKKRIEYCERNREYIKERYKKYCADNRENINSWSRIYRQKTNQKLRDSLSRRLNECIRKQKLTKDYLGTSVEHVKQWLEFNFTNEMSWENYGIYWSIDHVLPISKFDLKDDNEVSMCFSWMNLMPLQKSENISKFNKIDNTLFEKQVSKLKVYSDCNITDNFIESYKKKFHELV